MSEDGRTIPDSLVEVNKIIHFVVDRRMAGAPRNPSPLCRRLPVDENHPATVTLLEVPIRSISARRRKERLHHLLLQLVGERTQLRKELAVHRLERGALAVDADIQGGDDPAVELLQRDRDRSEPKLGLLVGQRIAIAAHLQDGFAQRALIDDGELGESLGLDAGEKIIEPPVVERCQKHPSERARDRGQSEANLGADWDDALGRGVRDHHDVLTVQHRRGAGLVDLLGQPLERRLEDVGDRIRQEVGAREVEDARCQSKKAIVHLGVAELHQRMECAPHRGARQLDELRHIAQRELPAVGVERLEHPQAARERFEKVRPGRFDQMLIADGAVDARHVCEPGLAIRESVCSNSNIRSVSAHYRSSPLG